MILISWVSIDMKLLTQKYLNNLLITVLIFAHLTLIQLATWAHLHPDEDHVETSGVVYHYHLPFLSSQASYDELDVHHTLEKMHSFFSKSNLNEGIVRFVNFNVSKKRLILHSIFKDDFCQTLIDSYLVPNETIVKILKFPIFQAQLNYLFLFLTDLSPPAS